MIYQLLMLMLLPLFWGRTVFQKDGVSPAVTTIRELFSNDVHS